MFAIYFLSQLLFFLLQLLSFQIESSGVMSSLCSRTLSALDFARASCCRYRVLPGLVLSLCSVPNCLADWRSHGRSATCRHVRLGGTTISTHASFRFAEPHFTYEPKVNDTEGWE
jgi:hypothetical protein